MIAQRSQRSHIYPSSCVTNLGAWFDNKLTMSTHVTKICNAAFYHLHNIRRIKKYLSRDPLLTLIHPFITSRLDYCNGLLYGLPNSQIVKLTCTELKYVLAYFSRALSTSLVTSTTSCSF